MKWSDIKHCLTSLSQNEITAINKISSGIYTNTKDTVCCFVLAKEYIDALNTEAWECNHCGRIWLTHDQYNYCPECGLEILEYKLEA